MSRPLHLIRADLRAAYEHVALIKAMRTAGMEVDELMRRARGTAQKFEHELALLRRGGAGVC